MASPPYASTFTLRENQSTGYSSILWASIASSLWNASSQRVMGQTALMQRLGLNLALAHQLQDRFPRSSRCG